jgi:GntR family transcriptional regulator, transcriptional repressor for pyruvate dehydrogenase complex
VSAAPDPSSTTIVRRRASEDVADGIRRFIATQRLEPGDRVGREEDLARRFGVSRPTVREAVRLLAGSHLIRVSKGPGGGIFVAATPQEGIGRTLAAAVGDAVANGGLDLEELLETWALVALPLARLASQRATPDDVADLRALLAEEEASPGDAALVTRADRRLHELVVRIAGNRFAAALTEWVGEVLQPAVYDRVARAIVYEVVVSHHRAVVDGIAAGQGAAAEEAMRDHLLYLQDVVRAVNQHDRP